MKKTSSKTASIVKIVQAVLKKQKKPRHRGVRRSIYASGGGWGRGFRRVFQSSNRAINLPLAAHETHNMP